MKKLILIVVSSLALASSLNASHKVRGEHCFRPAFQKKLKRVKSVGLRSFNGIGRNQGRTKKAVFIDWRKLYWGKLSDLIYSEEQTYTDGAKGITGTEEQNISSLDSQESQSFAKELRQELKLFAKQYGLNIVWRNKSLDVTDGTAAFLEYWDKGLSQEEQDKALPFDELCALSTRDMSAKITSSKGVSAQSQIKNALFSNPFLKKGA